MTVQSPHRPAFASTLLGVVGAVLTVAACGTPPQARVSTPAPMLQPAVYSPPPALTAPPATAPLTPVPSGPSLADLARGAAHFEGLNGKELLRALGDPNFRRHEAPAEVWQYYGPGCILDLFLYDDGAGAGVGGIVAHAELRGRVGQPVESACLSRLIDQRRGQRAG